MCLRINYSSIPESSSSEGTGILLQSQKITQVQGPDTGSVHEESEKKGKRWGIHTVFPTTVSPDLKSYPSLSRNSRLSSEE